jgi:cell wall-associated NlpC family hydrolase
VVAETNVTGVTSGADGIYLAVCPWQQQNSEGFAVAGQAGRRITRNAGKLAIGSLAAGATLLCVAVVPVEAAPKPPPKPSLHALYSANAQKKALAEQVGQLSAQIAQAQSQLQVLQGQAELAEQKYALAVQKLNDAKEKSAQAQAAVLAAQKSIDTARANLTSYVRNTYMSPSVGSNTIDLLTATDPTALLQGGDYQSFISAHHLDAMSVLDRATVEKSNAQVKAKQLLNDQQALTIQAQQAQQSAEDAFNAEKVQAAQLQASQAAARTKLEAAQLQLATLNKQRDVYLAYQRQQAAIAAAKARAEAEARARAAAAAAAAEAARAAAQAAQNGGGGGGGGNDSTSNNYGGSAPAGPSGGSWTAAKGQAAANKALSQLGVRYAWAGGNYSGPTYGVNSPGTDGWNDSSVYGFDCSGLTLFGWYPAIAMPHYAASQYSVAGSYHPSAGNFMPGDLLFWSTGGISGIHHVAMYIGNGNVVQAPNSGDVVKVTPWDQVAWGYYGATRPLT